ncbi:hypothetical protein OAP63_11560 [Vibrio sp.]|nr:hypothetical protein [Vibrio sp.]
MKKLKEIIDIEDSKLRFTELKKAFMPFTRPVGIDGAEREALTVLLNLSLGQPKVKDYLDTHRAELYFSDPDNLSKTVNEVQWFHTHNLKYPDCRVAEQRIIASPLVTEVPTLCSQSLELSYGWAHNSAVYKHTLWPLSQFIWRGKIESIFSLLMDADEYWQPLFSDFGFTLEKQVKFKQVIEKDLPHDAFPDQVHSHSKQVRFPWNDDYLSITPVVSHAMQQELEQLARDKECSLKFKSVDYPNSASIGNLCGSLGGYMRVMNYPICVKAESDRTLASSRARTSRYFDDYQLTSKRTCSVLGHLAGFEPLKTQKERSHVRRYQLKIIRKQIARWLLPLIELRDNLVTEPVGVLPDFDDGLVKQFLSIDEKELSDLATGLNQRLNLALQNNRFSSRFAYYPKLMQTLKRELIWVLDKLSKPEEPSDQGANQEQYIYLTSMRAYDALALSCPYLCGAPSLTAIWGFMHHYQREFLDLMSSDEDGIEFTSFAFFVRRESIQTSAKLTEPNTVVKVREVSPAKRPTILKEQFTDLVFDLVIKVKSNHRLSDHRTQLKAALPINFAGGSLFQPEIDSGINWLRTFSSRADLFQVIKGLPGYGCWLIPYSHQPTTLDELESILSDDGSLIPVANGFHFLEIPCSRSGSLTEKHAYAENSIGLAKRQNPIEIRFAGKDHFFEQAFWSLDATEQTILIKNKRI